LRHLGLEASEVERRSRRREHAVRSRLFGVDKGWLGRFITMPPLSRLATV
jgi:hypothetical protein